MARSADGRARDFLARRARDVTPACAGRDARVLYAPLSRDPEAARLCASVLSEAERQRASRFAAEHDQHEFEQRRAFRRFCAAAALGSSRPLAEVCFQDTERGRPALPDAGDLRFSFSSCRTGLLGAWSSGRGIGVDLEDASKDLEALELARRYFTVSEADAVEGSSGPERLRTFYQLWCLKEAALKSIGEGLPYGIDAFAFELAPALRTVHAPDEHGGPGALQAWLLEGTEGCAALVLLGSR